MKTIKTYLSVILTSVILLTATSCTNTSAQNGTTKNDPISDTVVKPEPTMNPDGMTVQTRFNTPEGFTRVKSKENSFGSYLQDLPLLTDGSQVKHFDGTIKYNTSAYCAVVDMPFKGNPNHQCADAVMRLRAEYLFSQKLYSEIEFLYVSGKKANYLSYLSGRTPTADNLWSYMCGVFCYANTYSLNKQLESKPTSELEIGDVFIIGGFPGHTVIVVDKCVNSNGDVKFMLAQSYMPAQDIQILVGDDGQTPWYDLNFGEYLYSAEYTFSKNDLKTF
jgi:hypothetical protein